MDELENKTPAELTEIKAEMASLQSLIFSVLVLILVVSGSFNLFLMREYKMVNADVVQGRQVVAEFQKNNAGLMEFLKKLSDYSHTHPDFSPIATKFGLNDIGKPGTAPAAPAKK